MFRGLLKLAAVSLPLVIGSVSQAAVWQATNTWNADWEQKFATYISNLPLDYFNHPGTPYYGIATDCADAAYTLRVIFAHENALPVDFMNHKNINLSNRSTEFDSIGDDHKRLRAFINSVNRYTDTGTLIFETYPISVHRGSVIPGTMLLHSPKKEKLDDVNFNWTPPVLASNHVFYVQSISSTGLINYISSTVPADVRNLNLRRGYVYAPFNKNSGYRAWKWPGTMNDPLASRLNGSEEQFKLAGWKSAVFLPEHIETKDGKRLSKKIIVLNENGQPDEALLIKSRQRMWEQDRIWTGALRELLSGKAIGKTISVEDEMSAVTGNINAGIQDRIKVVQDAWKVYQSRYNGRGCMNDSDYEGFSTPTRDTRIQTELAYLPGAAMAYLKSKRQSPTDTALARFYSQYRYEIAPGKIVNLNQIIAAFKGRRALSISEPEHSPEIRWGLAEYTSSKQWPCPKNASKYLGAKNF